MATTFSKIKQDNLFVRLKCLWVCYEVVWSAVQKKQNKISHTLSLIVIFWFGALCNIQIFVMIANSQTVGMICKYITYPAKFTDMFFYKSI